MLACAHQELPESMPPSLTSSQGPPVQAIALGSTPVSWVSQRSTVRLF